MAAAAAAATATAAAEAAAQVEYDGGGGVACVYVCVCATTKRERIEMICGGQTGTFDLARLFYGKRREREGGGRDGRQATQKYHEELRLRGGEGEEERQEGEGGVEMNIAEVNFARDKNLGTLLRL